MSAVVRRVSTVSSLATRCSQLRHFGGRTIPYVPQGTIQDLSGSHRHQALLDMQRELDERSGRSDTLPIVGPMVMGPDGWKPQFGQSYGYGEGQTAPGSSSSSPRSRRRIEEEEMSPREELEYERQLRQKMYNVSHDSFGPAPRGIVPPPPPPPPEEDLPQAFSPPQAEIGTLWYGLMGGIVVCFGLMLRYGN